MAAVGFKRRAVPAERESRPLPRLVNLSLVSGVIVVGNAEQRLERFDRGWLVTFAAGWEADEELKMFCWKVYPPSRTRDEAVEQVRRRARDMGIVKIGIVGVDEPELDSRLRGNDNTGGAGL